MLTLHRLLVVILLSAALLVGCGGENVHGSSSPPEEFGAQATAWFGCPDMQGMYAWPPEMGEYANGIATNKQPWPGAVPVRKLGSENWGQSRISTTFQQSKTVPE